MRSLFFFLVSLCCLSVKADTMVKLRRYGEATAPVQIYLFSSLACPHCADFHQDILPKIKEKYLDTHRAQLAKVDVIWDKNTLKATTLIRCVSPEKVPLLESELYQNQSQWASERKVEEKLLKYAQKQGLSADAFQTCLQDVSLQKAVLDQQNNLVQTYEITKLPTLVVRFKNQVVPLEGADEKQVMQRLEEFFEQLPTSKQK